MHGFFGSSTAASADSFSVWKGDATPGATGYDSYYLYNSGTASKWVKAGDISLTPRDADPLFIGDRSVLIQVKNDLHAYVIPNPSVSLPFLAMPQAATIPDQDPLLAAALTEGPDPAAALITRAFGLDALDAGPLPQAQRVGDNYVIAFTQPAGVTGITYGAEWSANLLPGSWTDIPDSGTGDQHIFSLPVEAAPQRFIRLKVTGP